MKINALFDKGPKDRRAKTKDDFRDRQIILLGRGTRGPFFKSRTKKVDGGDMWERERGQKLTE